MHCPGGNATDPILRVLASSDGISSRTPLKPQHNIPSWLSSGNPVHVYYANAVQKKASLNVCGWICSGTIWIHYVNKYVYIYIYIYIVIHRQIVSFYHNSSMWLDTRDAPTRDWNPPNFSSGWWHTPDQACDWMFGLEFTAMYRI